MPRFFIDAAPAEGITLSGETAAHIGRSLRMRVGDELVLCHGGVDYLCRIGAMTSDEVRCEVLSSSPCENEPSLELTLFQALPKGDKMEFIIQKAVELGVSRIVPFISERCVSRPDPKSLAKKQERWQKIAEGAAMQSGRGIIPEVCGAVSFEECLRLAAAQDISYFFYELGGLSLTRQPPVGERRVGMIIGSEGGFSPEEASAAEQAGLLTASLGRRILRCETAPLAAATALLILTGNM
ncbi:MAG: 16S rRNA (uracil(1498)-N(3))-methyltransferase [Ruminococcus sp.]|nr:16S rRNA (uracil(1498)-N(3))-methyltransferase [Ruminococcus sp.]